MVQVLATSATLSEVTTLPIPDWCVAYWLAGDVFPNLTGVIVVVAALLCMVLPYLIGSINPAILICKRIWGKDIRDYGNGDADFNNVWGACGRKYGLLVMVLDFLKATAAVWLGIVLFESIGGALAGFFVIFGHMFPIFHGLRGGKGMICLAGVVLTLNWLTFLVLLVIFFIGLIGTKLLPFASVMTALLYPLILNAFANRGLNVAMAVITTVFIVYTNRKNLSRMREGKEPKTELFKKKEK